MLTLLNKSRTYVASYVAIVALQLNLCTYATPRSEFHIRILNEISIVQISSLQISNETCYLFAKLFAIHSMKSARNSEQIQFPNERRQQT